MNNCYIMRISVFVVKVAKKNIEGENMNHIIYYRVEKSLSKIYEEIKKSSSEDELEKINKYLNKLNNKEELKYKWAKAWSKSLGLSSDIVGWSKICTDNPKFEEFLEKVIKLKKEGGNIVINSIKEYSNDYNANWYCFNVKDVHGDSFCYNCTLDKYKKNYEIKADQIPFNIHVAQDDYNGGLVSEKFRQVCIDNQLTGIDFIWAKDRSKYKTRQFFKPVCKNSMGIGIQREFIKLDKNSLKDNLAPETDYYIEYLSNEFKNEFPFINTIIKNRSTLGFDKYIAMEIFYKYKLPSTDFAYYIYEDEVKLYMSKRAKDVFIENNMKAVVGDAILERNELTNHSKHLIGFKTFYIEGNLDEKIEKSMKAYEDLMKNPRPKKEVNPKKVLTNLRRCKIENSSDYNSCLSKKKRGFYVENYPSEILDIYAISNGFYLNDEIEFLPVELIDKYTMELKSQLKEDDEMQDLLSEEGYDALNGIQIGKGAGGDFYVLLPDKRVIGIEHDDLAILGPWENLYDFINEQLQ